MDSQLHSLCRISLSNDTVEGIRHHPLHPINTNKSQEQAELGPKVLHRGSTSWISSQTRPLLIPGPPSRRHSRPQVLPPFLYHCQLDHLHVFSRATHVPVGHDQQQHLEFARECATNFNHAYGNHLVAPQTLIRKSSVLLSIPILTIYSPRPPRHVPNRSDLKNVQVPQG